MTHYIASLWKDNPENLRSILIVICEWRETYQEIDQNVKDNKYFDHIKEDGSRENESHSESIVDIKPTEPEQQKMNIFIFKEG